MPHDLRAAEFRLGSEHMAVLSFPMAAPALPDSLTEAERAVALAVVAGLSNAEIAAARGTSRRTIANQVAALFRKLKVRSRAELVVALAGPRPR